MKPLVFIHGFLLSGWIFTTMTKYFSARGYSCFRFDYSSRTNTISQSAESLQKWLRSNQLEDADFICHSMGGLVCRTLFESRFDHQKHCNVVCLGSPFKGSVIAEKLSNSKAGSKILGVQADSELVFGVHAWSGNANLGIIAGNINFGVGRLLGLPANRIGDGTVLVDETRISGLTDHIILPVTHTQLTFSNVVAQQADYFINHQRFKHNNDTN